MGELLWAAGDTAAGVALAMVLRARLGPSPKNKLSSGTTGFPGVPFFLR